MLRGTRYFRSTLDNGRLKSLEALWRYPGIFCHVGLSSPSGRFKVSYLRHYGALRDKRARAALASLSR